MTQIFMERDGNRYTISAKGHATGAPDVCAAVSTLLYTLAGYLHNIPCEIEQQKLEPGEGRICWLSEDMRADVAFDMACVGFLELEKTSAKHIKCFYQNIF